MNVWRKLTSEYNNKVLRYYRRLYKDEATVKRIYKEDIDSKFVSFLRDEIKQGILEVEDKLFLVRTMLHKFDTTFLLKISLMIVNDDEEMGKLAEVLIEEKLKECQNKKKKVQLVSS